MKFLNHYSSSRGNLYEVVASNGRRLLLEAGVRWQMFQEALKFNLVGIEACFVTHGHGDHCKAINDVLKAGIDVYASKETLWTIGGEWAEKLECGHYYLHNNTLVRLNSFEVFAFAVNHDCEGAYGFVVREKKTGEYLLFVTDTSHISQKFSYPFSIIAVECGYDIDILKPRLEAGEVNEVYAKRLLSSHIEKQNCIKYLKHFCNLSKCREIHLLHLSGGNIDKTKTRKEIEGMFFIPTMTVRRSKDAQRQSA